MTSGKLCEDCHNLPGTEVMYQLVVASRKGSQSSYDLKSMCC